MTPDKRAPIFVGGTGRSGTTIVAQVLGSHRDLHMIPIEVRFIVDPGGLCDVVARTVAVDRFRRLLLGPWWHRTVPDGGTRGLHRIMEHDDLLGALDSFTESDQGPEAARELIHRTLDASTEDSRRWIEMTPPNVSRGRQLLEILPDMKLIHSARDGRDVSCSVARLGWGPSDPFSALEWWGDRMVEAHLACLGMGPGNLLEVRMEDLVGAQRDSTIAGLFDFVGETPDDAALEFVASNVTEQRSNVERWRSDIDPDRQDEFQHRYEGVLDRIAMSGVPIDAWGFA